MLGIATSVRYAYAVPSGRAVQGVGLQLLASWDCGFESSWETGCPSVLSIVCCRVEVSATGCSLVQRSPTVCGVSVSDCEASII